MFIRKVIFLFVLVQSTESELFAQKIIDSINVCGLPVREGVIYEYNLETLRGCHFSEQTTSILTRCDSVFHFEDGKVVAIHCYGENEDGGYAIVIKNQKDEFISYSNLKYVSLKKGDIVEKGTWLGLTGISDDGESRQLDFMFFKKGKQLPFRKEVEYIRCSIPCEQQKGYTL